MITSEHESLDVDDLRKWIGQREISEEVLSPETVRRFDATFDRTGSLEAGAVAPPLIHWCLCQPAAMTSSLGEDGHPARGGFLPPVPLPRRMWAASSISFHEPVRIGDVVRRCSRISEVAVKQGRSGVLCFVTVQHEMDVLGRPMLSETQTIVYRPQDSGAEQATVDLPPADTGEHVCTIEPSAPLLFRYSALTFNGHRIHYDRTYATTVEHYPGLVIHGPLQATMLILFATSLRGQAPVRFSFRSQSPIFDDRRFLLHARNADDFSLKLWTAAEAGPVAMAAEAHWSL